MTVVLHILSYNLPPWKGSFQWFYFFFFFSLRGRNAFRNGNAWNNLLSCISLVRDGYEYAEAFKELATLFVESIEHRIIFSFIARESAFCQNHREEKYRGTQCIVNKRSNNAEREGMRNVWPRNLNAKRIKPKSHFLHRLLQRHRRT